MRMKLIALGLALIALLAIVPDASAAAAGTVVVTTSGGANSIVRYDIAWTSSAGGAVSGNPFSIRRGHVVQAQFVPNLAATQPTDLYDVTFVETNSVDYLIAGGANLSNASSKLLQYSPPLYHDGTSTVDLVIANAGNAKTGVVTIWVGP